MGSSGKLALAGNSWLAISQYFIAAEQPPQLACIAPLEGLSDPLREQSLRGGIPNTAFNESIAGILPGRNKLEDYVAMSNTDSALKSYLEDKRVDMTKIKVPTYIGASYSSPIHTIGSLRAFEEIPHQNKWYATFFSRTSMYVKTNMLQHPGSFFTHPKNGTTYTVNPVPRI
jgi:predicted acyl esterase